MLEIAFVLAAFALYFLFRVLVSVLPILMLFILIGYYLPQSTLENIPTLPDLDKLDRPDVHVKLTQLVAKYRQYLKLRREVHINAQRLGVEMTKSGLYDRRKNAGKLLNQQLDDLNIAIETVNIEIFSIRRDVYSTIPSIRQFKTDCYKQISRIATLRAWARSAWYCVGGAVVGLFLTHKIGGVLKSISYFDWPAHYLSGAGAGTLAALGSFLIIRRLTVAELTAVMIEGSGTKMQRWSELDRVWNPDDATWLNAELEADNGSEREAHGNQAAAAAETAWHEVLGVEQTASLEEIHSAWKTRLKEYHPDRVATLGPRLRELAEEETKALNAAYETAMQLKQPAQE